MKTIYRVLVLGILMMAFTAVTVTPSFAQDPQEAKVALYKKYTDNFESKDIEKKKIAIEAGKQYIEKYPEDVDQVKYFKSAIPALEDQVVALEKINKDNEVKRIRNERLKRFDTAVRGNKIADSFAVGKEVIANEAPDSTIPLDVEIVLASLGLDQAAAKVDTYNNDAINYAKTVMQKLGAGKTSDNFGAFQYEYKSKDNALGWMNYTIGYITYYRQDKVTDALPYLYKSTQIKSETNKLSNTYRIIGLWYLEEALRIDKDRLAKIVAAENKDTDETLALLALQKGYADRSIDAYARAYNLVTPKDTKDYKDGIYSRLQDLYKFRYDGDIKGIDAYVATVMSKPMPDPTTPVTPVAAETTTATTVSPTTTKPTPKPMDKPMEKPMEKPSTTTTTKPSTTAKPTTATKPVSTTTTKTDNSSNQATTTPTKPKTPAKKPVVKKKATR